VPARALAATRRLADTAAVRGGKGAVAIVVAPACAAPFEVEAVVCEEDTFLVLSAAAEVCEPEATRERVLAEAYDAEAIAPGSVVVRTGEPLRLLAIVHDLARSPSWREEWVAAALLAALRESEARRLHSLSLPLLGRVHGQLEVERFFTLLHEALARAQAQHLERLWLVAAQADLDDTKRFLERWS
jgi:hypothetical protein